MIKKMAPLFILSNLSFALSPAVMPSIATNAAVIATNNNVNADIMNSNAATLHVNSKNSQMQHIKGVMTCAYSYHSIPGFLAYVVDGCENHEPINSFFKRNRRSDKDEIMNVIYDEHHGIFIIYYGSNDE